jgi:hypothetical protein
MCARRAKAGISKVGRERSRGKLAVAVDSSFRKRIKHFVYDLANYPYFRLMEVAFLLDGVIRIPAFKIDAPSEGRSKVTTHGWRENAMLPRSVLALTSLD